MPPFSACITGKLRGMQRNSGLRPYPMPPGHHSASPVRNSQRVCPTLPPSDFDAPTGFLNLSAPCSFRCLPSLFQLGRTPRVSVLQRFPLFGCRHGQGPPPDSSGTLFRGALTLVRHPPPSPASLAGMRLVSVVWLPRAPSPTVEPDFLSRGRLPLLVLHIALAPWSSCEDSAACSAHLQGFELPKSPYCHRTLS